MARRSRNRRRAMQNGNRSMFIPGYVPPRRRTGTTDWIVSSASVDATGLSNPGAGLQGWADSGILITSGSFVTSQLVVINPVPMSSTPSVGRLRIDEVRGCVHLSSAGGAAACIVQYSVALYVSDLNNTTTLWNVRNPLTPADAARDDYLFLEGGELISVPRAAMTGLFETVRVSISLAQPVIIGGGQALHLVIAGVSSTGTQVGATSFCRTRVGPVA